MAVQGLGARYSSSRPRYEAIWLVLGMDGLDPFAALAELDKIGRGKAAFRRQSEAGMIRGQAAMIRAFVTGEGGQFLKGLDSLLEWHTKEAPREKNYDEPKFFICIPGLGLSKLAIQRGLLTADQLPQHNQFLPLGLL